MDITELRRKKYALELGKENVKMFRADTWQQAFHLARGRAYDFADLNGVAVQNLRGGTKYSAHKIVGCQTPDCLRGWRIDVGGEVREFHVNWWDKRLDSKDKSKWLRGANIVQGAGLQEYWEILSHFPPV